MTSSDKVVPFSLKEAPSLIEVLLPVQKLSVEVYREREARKGQTLTALGNFWKGRKPLLLNKACILGSLLPTTEDSKGDLEVFELLMGMDEGSLKKRLRLNDSQMLPEKSYREIVMANKTRRPEEIQKSLYDHIWPKVNAHLGTQAFSLPELVEQLGIMRFGRTPRVADTFSGSGQIPFEAARLGCDVVASDLNPVASLLTWGAFHIVGGSKAERLKLTQQQAHIVAAVQSEIDALGIESDQQGWTARNFLYCVEAICPETGWTVPLIPSLVLSESYGVVADLLPDPVQKRYDIGLRHGVSPLDMDRSKKGTIQSAGRGQDSYMVHTVNGKEYRTKISTLRGDFVKAGGSIENKLRLWERSDFKPRPGDIFQERLYAVLWMKPKANERRFDFEFRSVTSEDLRREKIVDDYLVQHLSEWQENGWVPDMRIEPGDKTDEPIRTRGWTHWHHLFNPRQLLIGALLRKRIQETTTFGLLQVLNHNSKLTRWCGNQGGFGNTKQTFDNQALNTLLNYGCRGFSGCVDLIRNDYKSFPIAPSVTTTLLCQPADRISLENDLYITDPPYGDAVKYEEILEFFIAWLRKNPPLEFADLVWDSRRSLAVKGEGEDFRRGMVASYKRMTECMPDNGLQVIMFTHQSGSIWADMANIVWASGLQVTAAWYVVTETDSSLREGSYVRGTVLLVCRKRKGSDKTTRDDLAWEIQDEVERQVHSLTGLNQEVKDLYRDENLFEDVDLQMAGYAAALRVLTRYAVINSRDMTQEAIRPRVKGQKTFVDELIEFAVGVANQTLVPQGIEKAHWDKLAPVERFYLKLIDLESKHLKTLDNYQNFAKAFKVRDFKTFMASSRANAARLKSAGELGKNEMSEGSEFSNTVLRGILYALMELVKDQDMDEVLAHLAFNVPNYYDQNQRNLIVGLATFLAKKLESLRPEEARAARILREAVLDQRL